MTGRVAYRRLVACLALLVLAGVATGVATHRVEHAAHLADAAHDHPFEAHFDPSPRADLHPCTVCNWSARQSMLQRAASPSLPGLTVEVVVFEPGEVQTSVVGTGASPRAPPLSLQS